MKKMVLFALASLVLAGASPAYAGGAFDFLDPCIKAKSDFRDERDVVRTRLQGAELKIDTMTPAAGFRAAWLKDKRAQARPVFDADVAPQLARYGLKDMDQAFDAWFKDMVAAVDPQDLESLISTSYRVLLKEELARVRSATEASYDAAKAELDSSCKSDVGSQVLRVVIAPLGWIGGNLEAGKSEKNIVTQVFRGVTGISAKDIAKHGILGGENSELRKLANTAAGGENSEVRKGLRFMDPGNPKGILGGPNSFFRKPFG
ncbi:MAG: hypothetical protein HYX38_30150 [Rhodospirillales bacterium]|nr:hypothetical protein [Rhodospirillales bacterium]